MFALHVPCEMCSLSCPVLTHGACEWFVWLWEWVCVWVRMCFVRVLFSAALYSHTVHANGLSPVWVRMCL